MTYFAWIAQERALSAAALTVRAQTISPNDQGRLLWDVFFPRRNVDSVRLSQIAQLDFRPVADRREWNARGRNIPLRTPNTAELEMTPIESYFKIGEKEIQDLEERTLGNSAIFRQIVGATIPERTDSLAQANFRRLDVDAMTAWALGTVTSMNPETGDTTTVTFTTGWDAARYTTAATAWDNAAVNAYDQLMSWLMSAVDYVGSVQGVMLRRATLNAIQADAPNLLAMPGSNIKPTVAQVEARIQDELSSNFKFYVNENTQDLFTDGGVTTARTKVWPTGRVAAIPSGEVVGFTAFAPVARAFDISRASPDAQIDVRGQTAYIDVENAGRGFTEECQMNALALPQEANTFVINAGV